ncbi:MAG: DUF929 family protein [Acidimicrobiales bacterium]
MAGTKQGSGGGKVPPRPTARPSGPSRPSARARSGSGGATRPGSRPGARPAPRASARQLAQRRRQRSIYTAIGSAGVVVVVVAIVVAVSLSGGGPTKAKGVSANGTYAIPGVAARVEAVPLSRLVSEASACVSSKACASSAFSGAVPPQKLAPDATKLALNGHPEILFVGAEYCPYCAAERWPLIMALSKFGTFSGLRGTTSSATDVNPSTPTFSFYGSTYTSKYLSFVPVEEENNTGGALQSPTPAQDSLVAQWDAPPYVPAQDAGQGDPIPFVYLGGTYILTGNQYDASALSGKPMARAVSYMTSGANVTSKYAEAAAGFLVGDICKLTSGQPANVCSHVPAKLLGVTTSKVSGQSSVVSTPSSTASTTKTSATKKASS